MTSLLDSTFAEPIHRLKVWSKYLLKSELKSELILLSESLSPKVRSKYILRPKFS